MKSSEDFNFCVLGARGRKRQKRKGLFQGLIIHFCENVFKKFAAKGFKIEQKIISFYVLWLEKGTLLMEGKGLNNKQHRSAT